MTNLKLRSIFLALVISHFISAADEVPAYIPTDHFLLDCGSSDAISSSPDNRQWTGDELGNYFTPGNASFTYRASDRLHVPLPYLSARVFKAPLTYTFPLSAGPKFVRLFFHPATYSDGLNTTNSYFSLVGNNYTLLSNFSAYLSLPSSDSTFFFKEFYINIPERLQTLNLTFKPNHNSYGFINGIEIVSLPDTLYLNDKVYYKVANNYIEVVSNYTAMEVVYRLNVGGNDVFANQDTGMFRSWAQDNKYLRKDGLTPHLDMNINYTNATPAYTAPVNVYTSSRTMGVEPSDNLKFNLTWVFPVHTGFMYILRLHFCEILQEVIQANYRVFSIYINGEFTWLSMDVFSQAGGRGIPIYRDFVVLISDGDRRKLVDLQLELHPYIKPKPVFKDAILNGIEIFKVNDSKGSLAAENPDVAPNLDPKQEPQKKKTKATSVVLIVGCVVGGSLLGFLLLCLLIVWRQRRRRVKDGESSMKSTNKSSWVPLTSTSDQWINNESSKSPCLPLPSDICRRFTFDEIITATGNFDSNFIIGSGGFGKVYRGYVDEGTISVAIKRLDPSSKQGAHEFQTEIEMLSKLRHRHLVSLIGYSDDNGEMVLVYSYMSHGTLRDHLYGTKNPPLSWKKRLEVCIGAARGLEYLHTGAKSSIIHRDVKSTNILLDETWVAKVSDFGLSKTGPTDNDKSHVSTVVKGSLGYVDPEYYRLQKLTKKSDVYSFGVVLLEVLSGRPAVVGLPKDQASLAEWGRRAHKKNMVEQIMDPNLRGQIAEECLRRFVDVAIWCLQVEGNDRPSMEDVVSALEFALQLQVSTGRESDVKGSRKGGAITTDHEEFSSLETAALRRTVIELGDEGIDSRSVFSQMSNPPGR